MKLAEVILETDRKFSNRDAEKLRGYIGNYFRKILPFHNHIDELTFNYDFAYIQYKVINRKLCIVGIDLGAELLIEHISKINEIVINDEKIKVQPMVKLSFPELKVEDENTFYKYRFETLWFALNSENYKKYMSGTLNLNNQLRNNIIEFFKMCKTWADKKIIVQGNFKETFLTQKDIKIKGFYGEFYTNVLLPDNISLGKRKTIGLGRIKRIQED